MIGIIYKVTNKINGKTYIGQTTKKMSTRWHAHRLSNIKIEFESIRDASRALKICHSGIGTILSRKKKTYLNYTFEYKKKDAV